jgi:BR serine/threonine kinase
MKDISGCVPGYSLDRELDSGAIGHVYLAHSDAAHFPVALKLIPKSIVIVAQLRREIALMKLFDHPNIVKLIDVVETDVSVSIVTRLARNGSLVAHLPSLSIGECMYYFRQMIVALGYLRSLSICHRDLKPANLLVDGGELFVGDFGFSCWTADGMVHDSCGSPHYAAPEVLAGGPYCGFAADVWSAGVILYTMLAVCTFCL